MNEAKMTNNEKYALVAQMIFSKIKIKNHWMACDRNVAGAETMRCSRPAMCSQLLRNEKLPKAICQTKNEWKL